MQIPIAQPSFGDEENDNALASGTIVQSQATAAFEEEFPAYCGVSYTAAMSGGSAALYAAGEGIPVHPGIADEARICVCETTHGVI